jgi:hypothetical protein
VDGGRLTQKGQSFSVKGAEFKAPVEEQAVIEEVKEGAGAVAEVGSEVGGGLRSCPRGVPSSHSTVVGPHHFAAQR